MKGIEQLDKLDDQRGSWWRARKRGQLRLLRSRNGCRSRSECNQGTGCHRMAAGAASRLPAPKRPPAPDHASRPDGRNRSHRSFQSRSRSPSGVSRGNAGTGTAAAE